MWLYFARASITRREMMSTFIEALRTGLLMGPGSELLRIRAFRLEPLQDGILAVDGERVEYGPIQAEVLPGIATIMALAPATE